MKRFAKHVRKTNTGNNHQAVLSLAAFARGIGLLLAVFVLLTMVHCSKNGNKHRIKAPGIVDGDILTLKAVVSGTLEELQAKEGDKVAAESVFARIAPQKIENQLEELDITGKEIEINSEKISKKLAFLDSNIRFLRKQTERFRRLKEKNAVAGEKLETMELSLLEAETSQFDLKKSLEGLKVQQEKIRNKRDYLQLLLDDHVIKVPVTGVVIETFVSAGETVFPGTAVADILDTASLYVEIFIEENELAGLKLNQKAGIITDGMQDQELSGVITYFGQKAEFSPKYIISEKERQSLLYRVKVKIDDPRGILKIGMPVTVVIDSAGAAE